MKFDTLNELIPYATGNKLHVLEMHPYLGVSIAMPGRHQFDTTPNGGDAVVMTSDTDLQWANHQFTHADIFSDVEKKVAVDPERTRRLMKNYAEIVILGADPDDYKWERGAWTNSLHPKTFLYSVQVLSVIEHRRYHQHEKRGGGRFLPARFASGIVEGLWTAEEAKKVQRRGRPGLEFLMKEKGNPTPLKELAVVKAA